MASAWGAAWGSAWGNSWGSIAVFYSGGYPQEKHKTRKQRDAERRKLGILPEIVEAAKKVVEAAQTVEEYQENKPDYQAMMLAELRVDTWLPDFTRAIEIQLKLRQEIEDEEEVLILLLH